MKLSKNLKGNAFMQAKYLKWALNLWPPYLGTGIKIVDMSDDYSYAKVIIKHRFYNLNYFGTHYGGNLFSMTDPFYILMITHRLGKEYYVWDKDAYIEYVKPGKGTLTVEFYVTDEMIADFKKHTQSGDKYLPKLDAHIFDENNDLIARLTRTIYIRKKTKFR